MSQTPPQPPPPPATPPPTPPPGQPPTPPPMGAPVAGPSEEIKSAEQKALIGMILGICNFLICNLLFIPALILGNQALAVLDRPGVESSARGQAAAARIMGIIGIFWLVLGVIFGIIWFVVIAGAAATSG